VASSYETDRLWRTFIWWHSTNLLSNDKPDRFFTIITFCMDETSGVAFALQNRRTLYQVEDEESRIHLLIHLPIEEKDVNRWCLWRPDHADFD